jgi:protoporphyrinogen oxidase
MKKVAVIGAGISGMSIAHLLEENFQVKIFEQDSRPGGLIKCDWVDGSLYHIVGGHVFNSKRADVLDWFWSFFNQNEEFNLHNRNAVISLNEKFIDYPIENHVYQLDENTVKCFINDLIQIAKEDKSEHVNFEDFLRKSYGETLYKLYFRNYNKKIWKKDLTDVPMSWLNNKLPQPTIEEMIFNNIAHIKETKMVHSTFFYPNKNGSQFIADKLADKLDITTNCEITNIKKDGVNWMINGENFDIIIFCGNIKKLPQIFENQIYFKKFEEDVKSLEYHGTTTVFCEIEKNNYSWVYTPDPDYLAHRIICTGNFANSNNSTDILTATIEFTNYISKDEIIQNISKMPFKPRYLSHKYTEFTYPVQKTHTREIIDKIKSNLKSENMYLLGRFAEWEYYNMDAAIGSAIDLSKVLLNKNPT